LLTDVEKSNNLMLSRLTPVPTLPAQFPQSLFLHQTVCVTSHCVYKPLILRVSKIPELDSSRQTRRYRRSAI